MPATNGSTRPKLSPEVQQRLCKVADWVTGGATREETIARTMQEWQLERRQAQKYLRRVNDRLRSDAEEDDLEIKLQVVQVQRMRFLRDTANVMHDQLASNYNVNHVLRLLNAATRLLADYEKTMLRQQERRGEQPKAKEKDAVVRQQVQQFLEAVNELEKETKSKPKIAPVVSQPPTPPSLPIVAAANETLPPIMVKPPRHRPVEMNEKEFEQYLARLEAAHSAHSSVPAVPAAGAGPKQHSGKALGNGRQQ